MEKSELLSTSRRLVEPIAIIGMGLRLPGNISTPDDFWQLMMNKKNARCRVPANRFNADGFLGASSQREAIATEYGYFLDNTDLEAYDTTFFTTNKKQVQMMDPQLRVLQQVVWECLESAGATNLVGTDTGVFVGTFSEDWNQLAHHDTQNVSVYRVLNTGDFILSNGISYQYDFRGPSMTIRAACSASMTGLHLACQALAAGDCSTAIVAGCSLILSPTKTQDMSAQGLLAKDGICKTFDAAADGYARAEGVNAVLIKPLDAAIRDGDPIRAVIRSTAVGSDGKTTNLGIPSPMCHESMIRHAYKVAGIDDVSQTAFIECHGTGTPVGDPLEMQTVAAVFGEKGIYCGSVKPNVGHTEGASGITSLIKAVLSLEHEIIPPNIHLTTPNPKIPFEKFNLKVPLEATAWPNDRAARISINCFGIGGANSHAILDSAKSFGLGAHKRQPKTMAVTAPLLLPVSATCDISARQRAADVKQYIREHVEVDMKQIAYTLSMRRANFPYRSFAVVNGQDTPEFLPPTGKASSRPPKVAFVFTGQGAQWFGMGTELSESIPSFRADLEQMDSILQSLDDPPAWSITDLLFNVSNSSHETVSDAEFSQPLTTAVQLALVNLLSNYGVTPSSVIGHSSGEIAAAYAAGALTIREAIICGYVKGLSTAHSTLPGGMLAVGMGSNAVQDYLLPGVCVACDNSPKSITLSGAHDDLKKVSDTIKADDDTLFVRKLVVNQAYHSPHMEQPAIFAEKLLANYLEGRTAVIPYYSSSQGHLASPDTKFDPAYWKNNIRGAVLFNSAAQAMLQDFHREPLLLVEIGPHAALQGPIRQIIQAKVGDGFPPEYISTLLRNKNATTCLLTAIGRLYSHGYPVNFSAINPKAPILSDLPLYPWNYSNKYWDESRLTRDWRLRPHPHHELLGSRHSVNGQDQTTWRNRLSLDHVPWLQDHKIAHNVVFPAAGFVAMMGEAVRQHSGSSSYRLRSVAIRSALIFQDAKQVELLTTMSPLALGERSQSAWLQFSISTFDGTSWTEHCTAQGQATDVGERGSSLNQSLPRRVSNTNFYRHMHSLGVNFGPRFSLLRDITADTNARHARATIDDIKLGNDLYAVHPTVIDGLLQVSVVASVQGLTRRLDCVKVPTRIGSVHINAEADSSLTVDAIETLDPALFTTTYESSAAVSGHNCDSMTVAKLTGIELVTLNTGEVVSGFEKTRQPVIGRCEWKRDINFCNITDLLQAADHPRDIKIQLERMTTLCILCVIDELDTCKILPSADYLQKYIQWLDHEKDSMVRGEYAIVPEASYWATLDPGARRALLEDQKTAIYNLNAEYASSIADLVYSITQPQNLHDILSGSINALQLYLQEDRLTAWYNNLGLLLDGSAFFELLAHAQPNMRILELGAGTGGTTEIVVNLLQSKNGTRMFAEYTYTDISTGFFSEAKQRFNKWDGIEYKVLDISKDPASQGFIGANYDLVIASNVLHATPSLSTTLRNVRSLLKAGGRLYFQEIIEQSFTRTIPFIAGLLSGWWLGEQDNRPDRANVSVERWDQELREAGFEGVEAAVADDNETYQEMVHITATVPRKTGSARDIVLLHHANPGPFVLALVSRLEGQSVNIQLCDIEDWDPAGTQSDIIFALDLEEPYFAQLPTNRFEQLIHLLSTMKTGCLWLTRSSQIRCSDPAYGLVTGLARTARVELALEFWTLELDELNSKSADLSAALTANFLHRALGAGRTIDCEYAILGGEVYIGRYDWSSIATEANALIKPSDAKQISIVTPGILDSITWVQSPPKTMQPDEVEVNIRSVGVNFRDIMVAMGVLQGIAGGIGFEAAGVITAVGTAIHNLKSGDRVLLSDHGLFTTKKLVKATTVLKIPDALPFEDAATMPLVYSTALYALLDKGELKKGQSVLIHSACGGVGQAAIQICQMMGAEIFATVGSEDKIRYLENECGIPRQRIFNSRNASFCDGIMTATGWRGVDLVLNSLSGDLLHASWRCVAKWGRMLEIGKRDMVERGNLPMDMFDGNRTFYGINLDTMFEAPEMLRHLLERVLKLYEDGLIKSLRYKSFEAKNITDAFRFMQKGQHIGKVVVALPEDTSSLPSTPAPPTVSFNSAATYLLVGGLGGLGRSLATWMVENGAKTLVFLSRSAASAEHEPFINELRSQGCIAITVAGSVTEMGDVMKAIHSAPSIIAGVVNLSAVIHDNPFPATRHQDWVAVLAPKVTGTYNLHKALSDTPLDFFLLFGSIAAVYGQPGQTAYAAANSFLDAFVQYRHGQGLPCSVIDIGSVLGFGVFGKSNLEKQFRQLGFKMVSEQDVLNAIELSVMQAQCQRSDASKPLNSKSAVGNSYKNLGQFGIGMESTRSVDDTANMHATVVDIRLGLARQIAHGMKGTTASGVHKSGIRDIISSLKTTPELIYHPETLAKITAEISATLCQLMIVSEDSFNPEMTLDSMGIDSLVSIEIRNWWKREIGSEISVLEILNAGTVAGLGKVARDCVAK